MSELIIRPVKRADVPHLVDAVLGGAGRPVVERRVGEHEAGYRHMLVAEPDGRVVGTVSTGGVGHEMPDSLRLFALAVGERHRGSGVGTALTRAVESRARELGLGCVNLEVSISNEDAVRLYKRLGCEIVSGPIDATWHRSLPDGCLEQVADRQWVMVKRLERR
jgi:ribosomal protein S18 acetylase RimI-like enzyme